MLLILCIIYATFELEISPFIFVMNLHIHLNYFGYRYLILILLEYRYTLVWYLYIYRRSHQIYERPKSDQFIHVLYADLCLTKCISKSGSFDLQEGMFFLIQKSLVNILIENLLQPLATRNTVDMKKSPS